MSHSAVTTGSPLHAALLLDQVHDAINATDANGILHTWNAGATRIYGYSPEEVLGKHVSLLFFPEDLPFLERHIFAAISGQDTLERRVRNRRKDGTEVFVALRLSILRDAKGDIEHVIGCSNDITERARAEADLQHQIAEREKTEAALHASEERLRHLITHSPGILYSCQLRHDLPTTFVSKNVEQLLGHAPTQPLDLESWMSRVHPDDRDAVTACMQEGVAAGNGFSAEYRFLHADGTYHWLRDSAVPATDSQGHPVELVGYTVDVTREKMSEDEHREHERLQYFSEALLAAQEAERKRISRELHDDLNQRLAALIVEMGVLERNPPATPEQARETCCALKTQVAGISDHVRDISLRLHSAGLEQFGLRAALQQECRSVSQQSGLKITFRARSIALDISDALALCFYRVAQECLRNVVRHANAGKATMTLSVTRDEIRLRVDDDGKGFSPAEARKRRTLGIMSMSERLRQVGGTLDVSSQPGSGTRVEARAPLGVAG